MGEELNHVHATAESAALSEMTPPHPPRKETAEYEKSHDYLIRQRDTPCVVCGVRRSTLTDPASNRFGAQQMETHHYPVERSLVDACDPNKVHAVFKQVIDKATLQAFVDSPANLIVLCDVHHRHPLWGIHHLLTQDFAILPFLYDGYQVVADDQNKAQVQAKDDAIMKENKEE